MKRFSFWMAVLAAMAISTVCVSCGDDNEEGTSGGGTTKESVVNPLNVFTGGLPKAVGPLRITTDASGLVKEMLGSDGTKVTFTYGETIQSRATSLPHYDVLMNITDGDDESFSMYLTLNENGFVSHCDEVESYRGSVDNDTWDFAYDNSGHLIKMVRSEGGKETTEIRYQDGDIVEVVTTSVEDVEEKSNYKIYYTSADVASPIDNKGCLMLFDNTLGIDMDEMIYAYYAGLLGKATQHLPVRCVDVEEEYTDVFTWTLNNAGYPTKLSFSDTPDVLTFAW